jgi:hypothetical protein
MAAKLVLAGIAVTPTTPEQFLADQEVQVELQPPVEMWEEAEHA